MRGTLRWTASGINERIPACGGASLRRLLTFLIWGNWAWWQALFRQKGKRLWKGGILNGRGREGFGSALQGKGREIAVEGRERARPTKSTQSALIHRLPETRFSSFGPTKQHTPSNTYWSPQQAHKPNGDRKRCMFSQRRTRGAVRPNNEVQIRESCH